MSKFGSKKHLRDLRTRARRELGTGSEPPTLEQLLRAAREIDEAIHALTLSSQGRLMVADGWGYALTVDEFVTRHWGPDDNRTRWMRSASPSVRLVAERGGLDSLFTSGLGAKPPAEWSDD